MDNKEKLFVLFLDHPFTEFHLRQAARESTLHPNTVMAFTEKLVQESLITKRKERNLTLFKANIQHPLFKIKKQAYNIERLVRSGLVDFLNEQFSFPTIILFGSFAKGENYEKSDIDLFVLAETKKKVDLSLFTANLQAEIQLFLHTPAEFKKLKRKNPELVNNIINGYKLAGFLEVL